MGVQRAGVRLKGALSPTVTSDLQWGLESPLRAVLSPLPPAFLFLLSAGQAASEMMEPTGGKGCGRPGWHLDSGLTDCMPWLCHVCQE